jgi:hypothetical protein
VGLLLIAIGAWFIAVQLVPGLEGWLNLEVTWPLLIVGVGVLLLVIGLVTAVPGMAIPGCIVGGIGGILYWQSLTGNWESWSYIWTLIPGFVGLGVIVSGLLGGRAAKAVREGGWLILISLVLFVVFGSIFGGLGWLGPYWPLLLVALGLLMVVRALLRGR